jgi:hypothetical protein
LVFEGFALLTVQASPATVAPVLSSNNSMKMISFSHSGFSAAVMRSLRASALLCSLLLGPGALHASSGQWSVVTAVNSGGPGQMIDVRLDDKPVARLIYGKGQAKPYLHVFGEDGELLTNPGIDENGRTFGEFPHHRGIFIGWRVNSELGSDDLWHMGAGPKMEVAQVEKAAAGPDGATVKATVLWRSARRDAKESDLLLTETRTLKVSRPDGKRTQVDASFVLTPARDIQLAGDLQHSGVHFRAVNEVARRANETAYIFAPDKQVKGKDFQWCRLLFPIGENWYTALQMSAPENPIEELSMRNYGRFGYFFKHKLKAGEELPLRFRFVIQKTDSPANNTKQSPEQTAASRAHCDSLYREFLKSLEK